MTSNRMEAEPIAGEHFNAVPMPRHRESRLRVVSSGPVADTAFFPFRGGGRCQGEHERFRMCDSHDEDKHSGPWESCQKCRGFWSSRDDKTSAENPIHWPRYCVVGDSRGPNPGHENCALEGTFGHPTPGVALVPTHLSA